MPTTRWTPAGAGLLAGVILAAVDAGLIGGAPRPVVMVALTLAAGLGLGALWHWRAWVGALAAGATVPAIHLAKHLAGLPDTIQPNTPDAIVMMTLFSVAVSGAGLCGGVLMRQAVGDTSV